MIEGYRMLHVTARWKFYCLTLMLTLLLLQIMSYNLLENCLEKKTVPLIIIFKKTLILHFLMLKLSFLDLLYF